VRDSFGELPSFPSSGTPNIFRSWRKSLILADSQTVENELGRDPRGEATRASYPIGQRRETAAEVAHLAEVALDPGAAGIKRRAENGGSRRPDPALPVVSPAARLQEAVSPPVSQL